MILYRYYETNLLTILWYILIYNIYIQQSTTTAPPPSVLPPLYPRAAPVVVVEMWDVCGIGVWGCSEEYKGLGGGRGAGGGPARRVWENKKKSAK